MMKGMKRRGREEEEGGREEGGMGDAIGP